MTERTTRRATLVVAAFLALATLSVVSEEATAAQKDSIDDPSSTFRLGTAATKPYEVIQVPLTLDTENLVNYFTNRVKWADILFDLVSVQPGPGLPDSVGVFQVVDVLADQVSFYYDTGPEPPIDIDPSEPVVVLEFEAQCFPYFTSVPISFEGGTALNYYNDEFGSSLGPTLLNGSVWMTINLVSFTGNSDLTYPGQQVVSPLEFYSTVDASPTDVILQYDATRLHLVSIDPGPGIDASDYADSASTPGLLSVHFVDPPLLAAETYHDLLYVTFEADPDFDDYVTTLAYQPGTTSVNVCGDTPETLNLQPFTIEVPDHTADLELADINPYKTADYYDVPFVIASSFPVDDYEFEVSYDAALTFAGAIQKDDYAFPIVAEIGPNLLHISEGINPDPGEEHVYVPEELPATVFYLRFTAPDPKPAAGVTFTVEFANVGDPQANKVGYEITPGPPPELSFADLTFESSTITTRNPPPPPTCPTLFVWNGKEFARENTILAACADGEVAADVTDFYRIAGQVAPQGPDLRFRIREDHTAISSFRGFDLLAVDHPRELSVRVTPEGEIIGLGPLHRVEWARDHRGRDVTELLRARDGVVYQCEGDGWIEVGFGVIRGSLESGLVAESEIPPKDLIKKTGDPEPLGGPVEIAVLGADGIWVPVGHSYPRYAPGRESTLVEPGLVPRGEKLRLRYAWRSFYRADAIEIQLAEPLQDPPVSLVLKALTHSERGSVPKDEETVLLHPGEVLDLAFDASALPPIEEGTSRDYVFVSTGRYGPSADSGETRSTPARTALGSNSPNPFNPNTTIHFSMATRGEASLCVYDVRGQLVRTLLAGETAAGDHAVPWDGRNDHGREVASGVYYYRLVTRDLDDTRKMLLLK